MAASTAHRLARSVVKRQDALRSRASDAGMPSVIKPGIWERARNAYFKARPFTHKELVQNQTAQAGME